jgi:hypothetical protein
VPTLIAERTTSMLKPIVRTIQRIVLAVAGGLGGVVVGGLLSLVLFHLKVGHSVVIDSFGLKVVLTLGISMIAGMMAPRFFMMFFLSPLSWFMDSDGAGGADVTWPDFLLNAAYMLGLVLFVFGAVFSLTWVAGVGLSGIVVFAIGVYRLCGRTRGAPKDRW